MELNGQIRRLEEAVIAFKEFVQHHPPHQPANGAGEDWLQRIIGHHPMTYSGEEDPVVLEGWIRDMDRTFEAVDFSPELQPNISAFFLRGVADAWWVDYRARVGPLTTWEAFKTALRTRFYPESLKRDKLREFMQLKQGAMTVRQYHARFTELLRFSPGIATNESMVVFQFEQGLNFGIRRMMGVVPFTDLVTLYEHACIAATLVQEQATILGKRKPESQSSDSRTQLRSGESRRSPPRDHSRDQRPLRGPACRWCGRNHPGRSCRGRLITCLNCGRLGHRVAEYWRPPQSQQNQTRPSQQGGALIPQQQAYQQHRQNASQQYYQRAPAPSGAPIRDTRGRSQGSRSFPQKGGQLDRHLNVISQAEANRQFDVITEGPSNYLQVGDAYFDAFDVHEASGGTEC